MDTPLYTYLNNLDFNNPFIINDLKKEYAKVVSSIRTLRYIKNLKDLLKILRKRDCITKAVLERIHNKLDVYGYSNNVQIRIPAGFSLCQQRLHHTDCLDKVYDIICDELGPKDMREMARKLNVKEARIDDFSRRRTMRESIREILRYHEENCIPAMWRQTLLEAIMCARRGDVHQKVEQKLDEYRIVRPY